MSGARRCMRLDELLRGIAQVPHGAGDIVVSGLTQDSRAVQRGDAFVALSGARAHGITFAPMAVGLGAVAVLAERAGDGGREAGDEAPVLWIENLRARLGEIAARFFDHPSRALTLIGVTGTNGKTSTVQLLAQALTRLGHRAATIGTLGAGLYGALQAGERTTPDVISVHALLAQFRDAGASHVAMEV